MMELLAEEFKSKQLQEKMDRINRTAWQYERDDRQGRGWKARITLWRLSLCVRFELDWNSK
ncbi:hypothetical protein [Paenibacillus alkalitolerans]|uniref:hypothetical protein n=1 Tax=Paenibacillus alkalitolerans TaxID=2799335 RepID=UPI0018F4CCC9|nr:hypothetical protein [Paenibacillus alkalitolerans]